MGISSFPLCLRHKSTLPLRLLVRHAWLSSANYGTQPTFTKDLLNSISYKLKDKRHQAIYPLKELVELYRDEEDDDEGEELLVDIKSELLSLYDKLCDSLPECDHKGFDELSFRLAKFRGEELLSGDFDRKHRFDKIVLEVKGGVGGEEANRFAADLFKMYENISCDKGFTFDVVDDGVAYVSGGAHFFKYEFGVHRVQRTPFNCKKIQTSSAVVTVVPHFVSGDLNIRRSDVSIETMRSRGAGGQSVNKSETAVRITHIPTGISVHVQDTSSQITNKARALQLLYERLLEKEGDNFSKLKAQAKLSQYKTGDRSERIRTFQFIHDSVIDHRCNTTITGVDEFLRSGFGIDKIHTNLMDMDNSKVLHFMIENLDGVVDFLDSRQQQRYSKGV